MKRASNAPLVDTLQEADPDLPEGWIRTRLERVLIPGGLFDGPFGSNLKTSDYTESGVRVIRLENVGHLRFIEEKRTFISKQKYESLKRHQVREGDIIFGSFIDGDTRVCILPLLDSAAIAKADCFCIRTRPDVAAPLFLASFLATTEVRNALVEQIHGATRPRINTRQLRQLDVVLPPRGEQQRILAKIETLFNELRTCRGYASNATKLLTTLHRSIIAAACSGRLTEDWRITNHADLEGWTRTSVGEAANMRLGKMLDQVKNVGAPTAYLRNVNVRWFSFELSDLLRMRATKEDKREFSIEDGDLLVCEGGEPGRCAVWNLGTSDLIFQKAIHRIRLKENISPHWLALNLRNDAGSGSLDEYFTGSGIKHLTGRSLAAYTFSVPSMAEQEEIVRRATQLLALAHKIERGVADATKRMRGLTQSILSRAFRGDFVEPEAALARQERRDYDSPTVLLQQIAKETPNTLRSARSGKVKNSRASKGKERR